MRAGTPLAVRLAAAVVAGSLAASCGLPPETEPHRVELPLHPLASAAPSAAGAGPPGEVAEVVCLVRDGRIVQSVRRVQTSPTAQVQVEHLVAGPTTAERANGLTTALVPSPLRVDVPVGGTEARVEVGERREGSARSDDIVGYGQIVCTLTSRADVNSVYFTRGGAVLQVPRADGSLSRGPLSSRDYARLIAPS